MKPTVSEKLIAYLALLSGLSISAVAVYYSVIGLTAIFAAAAVPIIIMGVALEVSKLVATVWLKQNWSTSPRLIKGYLVSAVVVLMLITSMGIFGFLSKAHLDQSVPTGDVVDKIALIDEKIKTQRENIDAARKALKQMDESVDQIMARSSDERGAEKAAQLRRVQQRERAALQRDIANAQNTISALNNERAPVAKELRKVEAEVGPIKYIANFIYDETDNNVLEKAVTWVIIILVLVFDPLAVVLLLAAQTSFQQFRIREQTAAQPPPAIVEPSEEETVPAFVTGVEETSVKEEIEEKVHTPETHPYLKEGFKYPAGWMFEKPIVAQPEVKFEEPVPEVKEAVVTETTATTVIEEITSPVVEETAPVEQPVIKAPTPIKTSETRVMRTKVFPRPSVVIPLPETYIQNEEQKDSNLWSSTVENNIDSDEYIKTVQAKREEEIKNYAELVRSKQIQMEEVPEEYQTIVRSMV